MASASANASVSLPRLSLTRPSSFTPVRFTPVEGTIQTPDVNILANSLKNMEQRRYTAAEQMAKVNDTISKVGSLLHNDEETQDWFNGVKASTIDKLQSSIDEGNYGQAIFDSIQQASKLLTRPDVEGRIKANAAYEEFRKGVNSANISDDQKQYLLATNPYYYFDRYEGETEEEAKQNRAQEKELALAGNPVFHNSPIVGGTSWTPNQNAVAEHDISEVLKSAMEIITADKGKGYSLAFRDLNGNETTEANSDGYYYAKKGSTWERLDAATIEQAMNRIMASNPAYRDSFNRQYDIMKWKYDNGKEQQFGQGILDQNGIVKGRDQWINDIIKETARGKAYNHVFSDIDINESYYERQKQYQKAMQTPAFDYTSTSQNDSFKVDISQAPTLARIATVSAEKGIRNLLGGEGSKYKYNQDTITKLLNGELNADYFTQLSPDDKANLSTLLAAYNENNAYYQDIISRTNDKDVRDAIDFTAGAFSYDPNATDNKYAKRVAKYINDLGLTNDDFIYLKIEDANKARAFEEALGIQSTPNGNESVISIPVSDYSKIITAASMFQQNSGILDWENGVKVTTSKETPSQSYTRQSMSLLPFVGENTETSRIFMSIGQQYNNAVATRDEFLNSINKDAAIVSNINFPGQDFSDLQLLRDYNAGKITEGQYNKNKEFITKDLDRLLRAEGLVNKDIYVLDPDSEHGNYLVRITDPAERERYSKILKEAYDVSKNNVEYNPASFAYSPNGYGTNITIKSHRKQKGITGAFSDNSITIYVDGLYSNTAADAFVRDTNIRANHRYTRQESINGMIQLSGTGSSFDGKQFQLSAVSKGGFSEDTFYPREKIVSMIDAQNVITDLRDQVNAYGITGRDENGRIPEENVKATIATAATQLCDAVGAPEAYTDIKSQIEASIIYSR